MELWTEICEIRQIFKGDLIKFYLLLLLLPGKGPGSSLNVFGPAGLSKTGKNSRVPKASIKTG